MKRRKSSKPQAGFSLVEMLIAMVVMTIVMGAIFEQINTGLMSSSVEQTKLDLFQESREFMDQMTRDLRASGYPNTRNFAAAPCSAPTEGEQDCPQEAIGLIKIDVGDLWFEATTDGTNQVRLIQYHLDNTCTPLPCLRRAETLKLSGSPIDNANAQLTNYQTEVQNVLNGTTDDPIFQAYNKDGNPVPLPLVMDPTATTVDENNLININTVAVTLKVQSPQADPQTHQKPTITLLATVRLNNCSVLYPNTLNTVMGCR